MLRSVSPLDPEYDLRDLINDFHKMVNPYSKESNQDKIQDYVFMSLDVDEDHESGELLSKEQRFRRVVYEDYIKQTIVALDAMRQGMMLYGAFKQYSESAC